MPTEERQELLEAANDLGLEFKGNISNEKLRGMVAEAQGPAIKEEEPELVETPPAPDPRNDSPVMRKRRKINAAKKAATKKRIVTITNKDNRENEFMTTVHLSVENQYFSISRIIPLDIPVEIEQCLITNAETTMMTLHKDEVVKGRRTGNKITVRTKKFAVSYAQNQPQ